MPRQGRIHVPGGIYHVIQRGLERKEIFHGHSDYAEFLRRLEKCMKDTGHKCYGWSLMPNHFHLLMRSGVKPLSDLMRKLLTGYAVYHNNKYARSGYLYQNRYKSILCQEDTYLLELVRYIHLNPLRAGLVKDMNGLNIYKWSGHSVLIGRLSAPWQSTDEVLQYFGKSRSEARRKYLEFVCDAENMGKREEYAGGGLRRSAGGWSAMMALRKAREYHRSDERVLGDGEFVNTIISAAEENSRRKEKLINEGWDYKKVELKVSELFGINAKEIYNRSRLNNVSKARKVFMYFMNKQLGVSGLEIAEYLGISDAAVSKGVRNGEKLAEERNLKLIS